MKEKECIFCKITEREISSRIIFEDDLTLAFLDISPISTGHTIIIPKNHYSNLEDIPSNELSKLYKTVKKIAIRIHKNLEIDGYNVLQNNFKAAGQDILHFHVHIIPRKYDDDKFRIKIPRIHASDDELEEVFEILKS